MTPVETFKAAAAKVREKGVALTSAGAETGWPDEWREFFTLRGANLGLVREDEEWIALMSPAVAQPLAAWLESMAVQLAGAVHSGNDYCDLPLAIAGQLGDGVNSCKCPDVHAALALARTLLGEAP